MLKVLVPSDGSANSQYGVRHVMSAPRPAEAGRPPRGSRKVAKPHFLESEFLRNRDLGIHVLNVQRPIWAYVSQFSSRRNRDDFRQGRAETALKPARQALEGVDLQDEVEQEADDFRAAGLSAPVVSQPSRRLYAGGRRPRGAQYFCSVCTPTLAALT